MARARLCAACGGKRYDEGGTRPSPPIEVRGRPSCGFPSGFLFIAVCSCSLLAVGVPVKIPVNTEQVVPDVSSRPCKELNLNPLNLSLAAGTRCQLAYPSAVRERPSFRLSCQDQTSNRLALFTILSQSAYSMSSSSGSGAVSLTT
jgi:hypothetical protein